MRQEPGRAKGVSLWLVPEGAVRERLGRLIAELARRHGTPPFEPHVTLLGGLVLPEGEVLAGAQGLTRSLGRPCVQLTVLDASDEYFRGLFVRVEETETLLAAHALAAQTFGGEAGPPFVPHLSLLYGHLTPDAKREALSDLAGTFGTGFEAGQLQVVRTEGPPADWRVLAALPLGSEGA